MNLLSKRLSIVIVSHNVGKTPEEMGSCFVFDEAHLLAKKGIEVHLVTHKVEGDSFSYGMFYHGLEKRIDLRTFGFTLNNLFQYSLLPLLRNPTRIYKENLYAMNLFKVIKENRFDLIHAHFAHHEGFVGLLVKRKTGIPLVVTIHGYDILTEPSVGYGERLSKRSGAIVRKVLNNADAVIAASKTTLNEASRIVNDTDKVHLIPNGVDLDRFNPCIDGQGIKNKYNLDDRFIVFSLRTHKPIYGLEYLIRAIPFVTKHNDNIFFIIGGDGSLRKYHELLSKKLGVEKNVKFTGYVPRNNVPSFYAASDVVVIPSLQEAFGLVVTESMASCKPVIGSDVGGIPDQIIDGYNGFLVKPRDPQIIADKILWLYDHPDEAREMGLRGRRIAEEKFDIKKRIFRIISLYNEILEMNSMNIKAC